MVCQIEHRVGANIEEKAIGTDFLIGPDLLLTNQHVVADRKHLSEIVARFGYQADGNGVPLPGREVPFQPDFYFSSDSSSLDYALLRLQDEPLKHIAVRSDAGYLSYLDWILQGKHRGYLVLAERFIKEQDRLNVLQHPDGKPMKCVLTQNHVVIDMTETRVQYVADTMNGSSGSPVFNQNWEVVALHHSGKPYPPDSTKDVPKKAWKGHFRVNEGIPIRAILKDFREKGLDRYLPQP
ncbi:MAG: trypsin-like peptidase domain-containing protein [Chloroflexi bacterium]|nr:MAG: trypsin-like peptidase domain-containing protein [Chloroflexota bacterium]